MHHLEILHDGAGVDVDGDDVVVFGGHCQLHVERTERSGDGDEKECFYFIFRNERVGQPRNDNKRLYTRVRRYVSTSRGLLRACGAEDGGGGGGVSRTMREVECSKESKITGSVVRSRDRGCPPFFTRACLNGFFILSLSSSIRTSAGQVYYSYLVRVRLVQLSLRDKHPLVLAWRWEKTKTNVEVRSDPSSVRHMICP